MPLSIFAVSNTDLLCEIFSYETSENLYKYTRRVNIQWQKAAIIELFRRRTTSTDIFYQQKLFKETFSQRLYKDDDFVKIISAQIVASMASPVSTPTHKWQASFFLCHLNKIPDGFIADNAIANFSLVYLRRSKGGSNHSNYNDNHHNADILAAVLPQTQIDRVISNLPLTEDQFRMALYTRLMLAKRIKPDQMDTCITSIIQRLDDKCGHYDELRALGLFTSKLKPEQIDTAITKILAQVAGTYRKDELLSYLMLFAPWVKPAQAYSVFITLIPFLNLDKRKDFGIVCDTLNAFVSKLDKDQSEALIATNMHLILQADQYGNHPLLDILVPKCTSDQAYTIFLALLPKLNNNYWRYCGKISSILKALTLRLNHDKAQELIISTLSKMTTKLDHMVLDTLILLPSHFLPEQVGSVINTMTMMQSSVYDQCYYALRTVNAFIPQLTHPQINTIFITLNAILDNDNANYNYNYDHRYALKTLKRLAPHLTKPEIDIVLPKVISVLGNQRYREDGTNEDTERQAFKLLIAMLPNLDETQITIICNTIKGLDIRESKVSNDLRNALLNTITALVPRLNKEPQINALFTVAIGLRSNICHGLTRLKALAALMEKLTLTERQIDLLVSDALSGDIYDSQESDFYNTLFHITIKLAPSFNEGQALHVFYQLMRIMGKNPELNDETSTAFLPASHACTTLALQLTPPQVDICLSEEVMPLLNQSTSEKDRLMILAIFKALAFRLDETQMDVALTHIIPMLDVYCNGVDKLGILQVRGICRVALNVVATFVPRLNKDQVKTIFTAVSSLAGFEQDDEIRQAALIVLNTLLIANKLDFNTLQQWIISNDTLPSPFLIEAITTLEFMTKIRTDVAQSYDRLVGMGKQDQGIDRMKDVVSDQFPASTP